MRIGLLGGSFDPPHAGHRAASLAALRRLRLDQVWWLVAPGNPLKPPPTLPLERRVALSRAVARHPRIAVTSIEAAIGSRYTIETLRWLVARTPGVRFVWLMGADNLADFDRWRDWRGIVATMPIAVIDRPDRPLSLFASPLARHFGHARVRERDAARLVDNRPAAWAFLHGPRLDISSTALRAQTK
jgi:nicotinate-nucleotide adenylyltransferase